MALNDMIDEVFLFPFFLYLFYYFKEKLPALVKDTPKSALNLAIR